MEPNSNNADTSLSCFSQSELRIAVIGEGYVGLLLAIEFAAHFSIIGFDISESRVSKLNHCEGHLLDADFDKLNHVLQLAKDNTHNNAYTVGNVASADASLLEKVNVYIVTLPTPIDEFNAPDLLPLKKASEMIGGVINSSDKIYTFTSIVKVTSVPIPEMAEWTDQLYKTIIKAGTHKAPSLKVAEASKAIENAQRDVNISFVNELALIFDRVGIDTIDVLEAAGTKFNFLKYKPGLVGGHCISVDPYYLSHKAIQLGYHPDVILSGRRVNDKIGAFVADKVVKLMIQKDHKIKGAHALIMGITFKENCPDIRNTRVIDIYHELLEFGLCVDIYDPLANAQEVMSEYGLTIINKTDDTILYDAIILAVAHTEFLSFDFNRVKRNNGVIFDTKACLDRALVDGRL